MRTGFYDWFVQSSRVLARVLLPNDRYEAPSLHTAKWEARLVSAVGRV